MKLFEKRLSARARRVTAWLMITLFALPLSGSGAVAFPINITQDKNYDVATAKRFVGTWKGRLTAREPVDRVFIFKIEGDKLTGVERSFSIHSKDKGKAPQIAHDEYIPLPNLTLEGTLLTWKTKREKLHDIETLHKMTIINDGEILVEFIGVQYSNTKDQSPLLFPVSYKLKREK